MVVPLLYLANNDARSAAALDITQHRRQSKNWGGAKCLIIRK